MTTNPIQPTQVREPGKAALRTVVQTTIGVLLALGIIVPAALAIIGEELQQWLPPYAVEIMGTVAAAAVAISAITARIMAIPTVNAWLARVGLSAGAGTVLEPPAVVEPIEVETPPAAVTDTPEPSDATPYTSGTKVAATGYDGIPDQPRRAAD